MKRQVAENVVCRSMRIRQDMETEYVFINGHIFDRRIFMTVDMTRHFHHSYIRDRNSMEV